MAPLSGATTLAEAKFWNEDCREDQKFPNSLGEAGEGKEVNVEMKRKRMLCDIVFRGPRRQLPKPKEMHSLR